MQETRKRLLVTGADGFTGRHLVAAAVMAGFDVRAFSANLTDADAVSREVASLAPDFVIHLAAISAVTHHDAFAFYRVNVFGTENLLAALARLPRKPSAVLLASSANVYGNCEVSPIAELVSPAPVNHHAKTSAQLQPNERVEADARKFWQLRNERAPTSGQRADEGARSD